MQKTSAIAADPGAACTVAAAPALPLPTLAGVAPRRRRLVAGAALFRQGDAPFGVFRLASGRIDLLRMTPDGVAVPMHTVRAGELFAEASLFAAHYHCDAIAREPSAVLVYPKDALTRALRRDAEAMWAFAADLAQRVQGLRSRLETGRIRSARLRVMQALRLRCDGGGLWRIDGTLKDFAGEIGLTHEALYRALAALERDGRIVRRDGAIGLVPPQGGAASKET